MATVGELRRIMPGLGQEEAEIWAPKLDVARRRFQILGTLREAMFLAQIGHESQDLTRLEENLRYTAQRLVKVWPSRFPTQAAAKPYEMNPEGLANRVYGGRFGNTEPGDGYRFRGRGPIQITGRSNYARCGEAIGQPLIDQPDYLLQKGVGSLSAAWFWSVRRLNELADVRDVEGVTERINGGDSGLPDRKARYERALAVLEGK